MADECRDSSGEEKLALFFRYVWFDAISRKYSVHEDFTQFLHCHRMSGAALFHLLMGGEDGGYMGRKKIDLSKGRGQAYDGGGNMAGKHNGLQAHVTRANSKFLFVHCHGHIMNLCLAKACEQTQKVVDHVQQITIAFEYSSKRQQFFREAIQANPEAADPLGNKKKISMLCETRWSARGDSFSTVKNGIFPLVSSLEKLEEEKDEQASGLLAVILQFPFVVTIVILAAVLQCTSLLSTKLQYETLDFNDACRYAKQTTSKFEKWVKESQAVIEEKEGENKDQEMCEPEFDKLFKEAQRIAQILGVNESFPREIRRRPQELAQYADLHDYFKKKVFLPFLETMIEQLETRLLRSQPHFRATDLLPSNMDFLLSDEQILAKLQPIFAQDSPYYDDIVELGNIDTCQIEQEHWIALWRETEPEKRPQRAIDCLNAVNIDWYPNIKVVLIHFLTLPVTTCSVERSFSEMRLLKTWLRSTMTDTRLSSLALMHLQYDEEIPFKELIKKWSQVKSRLIELDITEWISNENI